MQVNHIVTDPSLLLEVHHILIMAVNIRSLDLQTNYYGLKRFAGRF